MSFRLKTQLARTQSTWRHFSSTSCVLARQGGKKIRHSKAILATDPVHDAFQEVTTPSGSVRVWNDPPPWALVNEQSGEGEVGAAAKEGQLPGKEENSGTKDSLSSREAIEQYNPQFHLPVARENLRLLHRYPLVEKRVQHQTGKGRIASFYALTVVGNGRGLMGYGEGKGEDILIAREKSFVQAVRSMDTVDRFEERTLWYMLNTKFGATKVIMRPRPVGFGLHCNPNIHQVCKAAGIKDISAKVWGSRNPMNVIKATVKLLHAGNAHLNMGDGIGGKGRRLDKGSGMSGRQTLERERGRKIIDYRTW
jgi:small subunit ribosomal protein S5